MVKQRKCSERKEAGGHGRDDQENGGGVSWCTCARGYNNCNNGGRKDQGGIGPFSAALGNNLRTRGGLSGGIRGVGLKIFATAQSIRGVEDKDPSEGKKQHQQTTEHESRWKKTKESQDEI